MTPHNIAANGLWNIFTGRKKWTVTCGKCRHTWRDKLPIVENVTAICPNCNVLNKWSASAFSELYNNQVDDR